MVLYDLSSWSHFFIFLNFKWFALCFWIVMMVIRILVVILLNQQVLQLLLMLLVSPLLYILRIVSYQSRFIQNLITLSWCIGWVISDVPLLLLRNNLSINITQTISIKLTLLYLATTARVWSIFAALNMNLVIEYGFRILLKFDPGLIIFIFTFPIGLLRSSLSTSIATVTIGSHSAIAHLNRSWLLGIFGSAGSQLLILVIWILTHLLVLIMGHAITLSRIGHC